MAKYKLKQDYTVKTESGTTALFKDTIISGQENINGISYGVAVIPYAYLEKVNLFSFANFHPVNIVIGIAAFAAIIGILKWKKVF